MAATRDELREHLLATLEAAQELPREDRGHLADVFLDELETHYRLVSRSALETSPEPARAWRASPLVWGWWPIVPLAFGLVFLLPLLLLPLFVVLHPPIFFVILILFFLFRFVGPGFRRRRMSPRW